MSASYEMSVSTPWRHRGRTEAWIAPLTALPRRYTEVSRLHQRLDHFIPAKKSRYPLKEEAGWDPQKVW